MLNNRVYRKNKKLKGTLKGIELVEGESRETKVKRAVHGKEPLTDGAPEIYTDKKEGVKAGFDMRADKWEIAADAMNSIERNRIAKGEALAKNMENEAIKESGTVQEGDNGVEPIHGKNNE